MTITTCPDVHGRNIWQQMPFDLNIRLEQRIIFIGDYCDNFHFTDQQIYEELEKIIELKERYPEQVILLVGNHDVQYIFNNYYCSGYRQSMSMGLNKLFNQCKDYFQFSYQYKDHLWTHAGITTQWLEDFGKSYSKIYEKFSDAVNNLGGISEVLNNVYLNRFEEVLSNEEELLINKLFQVSEIRGGKQGNISGPLWADLKETSKDYLKSFHQICGHTPVEFICTVGNKKESITYTDCHRDRGDFLIKSF